MSRFGSPLRATGDLVPLVDRMRALAWWRTGVFGLSVLVIVLIPGVSRGDRWPYVGAVLAYIGLSEWMTRRSSQRNRRVLLVTRALLMCDSVVIVMLSLKLGGPGSALRYLIILQAVEVTLLASFRTGLRLVTWQSLLVSGLYAVGGRLYPDSLDFVLDSASRAELIGVVLCSWIAAITTAFLAADNERELRRRRYDLEQLAHYHGTISEVGDVASVAGEFVASAVEEFEATRVVVALPESDGTLRVVAAEGFDTPPATLRSDPGSLVADALSSRSTRLATSLQPRSDADLLQYFASDAKIVVLPMRTTDPLPGLILVERNRTNGDRVGRRVVSMLERYRDELESRVSNLMLIGSLRTAATTDALTGVANRGRLREALRAETQESIRRRSPLCVIILDVDHFKKVNDVHGHAAGDVVLTQVASVLKGSVRPYDIVARYGGEEFVVLLPGTDLPEAAQVAERLRSTVATSTDPVAVTISLGLARFDPTIDDEDHVIARADELLYQAKQNGRNQVRIASQRPFGGDPALASTLPPPVVPPL